MVVVDDSCSLLARKDQGASTTLALHPNCSAKSYGRRIPDSTVVYSNKSVAYKRKITRVVRVELLKRRITSKSVYTTHGASQVAQNCCNLCKPPQPLIHYGTKVIDKAERKKKIRHASGMKSAQPGDKPEENKIIKQERYPRRNHNIVVRS